MPISAPLDWWSSASTPGARGAARIATLYYRLQEQYQFAVEADCSHNVPVIACNRRLARPTQAQSTAPNSSGR
jgi:hypothetical protein